MDAADDHKEKESGLPDPVVKLSDLISSSQDTWGLDNRHEAGEKVGRVGGLEGLRSARREEENKIGGGRK